MFSVQQEFCPEEPTELPCYGCSWGEKAIWLPNLWNNIQKKASGKILITYFQLSKITEKSYIFCEVEKENKYKKSKMQNVIT